MGKKDTQKAHTKNKGGAPKGNQNKVALKDIETKKKAYLHYCNHVSEGKAKKSWYYDRDGLMVHWETMEKYMDQFPVDLDPKHMRVAEAKGYQIWENVVAGSATGDNEKANTASLQMIMRNKFGWDKKEENTQGPVTINLVDYSKA